MSLLFFSISETKISDQKIEVNGPISFYGLFLEDFGLCFLLLSPILEFFWETVLQLWPGWYAVLNSSNDDGILYLKFGVGQALPWNIETRVSMQTCA